MALYHVYRPQKFSEIVGQEHIVKTLSNQIKKNTVAHAYLFSGPRGTGKTTTARILAKAMNCQNKKPETFEPCNECSACIDITAGKAIDVIEIDAASHTGVDHVREHIIENAQFRPTFLTYKIFIIDEVHMLSTSAFNALLKTLEEPPSHIIFILATTDVEKIPETIISRCQRFTFQKMEDTSAHEYLKKIAQEEGRKIDEAVLDVILSKSEGGMRDAISLLDQVLGIEEKNITLENTALLLPQVRSEDIQKLLVVTEKESLSEILNQLNELTAKGTHLLPFTDEFIGALRDILLKKIQKKEENFSLSPQRIFALIDILLKRRQEIRTSPIATLPLEMAFIEWIEPSEPEMKKESKVQTIPETVREPASPPPNKAEIVQTAPQPAPQPMVEVSTEQKIEERLQPFIAAEPGLEFQAIERKWTEVLSLIEKDSPSLIFILRMASLLKVEGDTLVLSVPFKFHQSKLTDKLNQRKIESVLAQVYGAKLHFDIIVQEKETLGSDVQELAALIGGEVL